MRKRQQLKSNFRSLTQMEHPTKIVPETRRRSSSVNRPQRNPTTPLPVHLKAEATIGMDFPYNKWYIIPEVRLKSKQTLTPKISTPEYFYHSLFEETVFNCNHPLRTTPNTKFRVFQKISEKSLPMLQDFRSTLTARRRRVPQIVEMLRSRTDLLRRDYN